MKMRLQLPNIEKLIAIINIINSIFYIESLKIHIVEFAYIFGRFTPFMGKIFFSQVSSKITFKYMSPFVSDLGIKQLFMLFYHYHIWSFSHHAISHEF